MRSICHNRVSEKTTLATTQPSDFIGSPRSQDRKFPKYLSKLGEERLRELQAQLFNLEPARQDIEATLADAAKAAGELADKRDALREAEKRLAEVTRDLDPERIDQLRQKQKQV